MTCELCNRHGRWEGAKRLLKFRRGRGFNDPHGGEFLARVDKGVIRFTWDCWLCVECDRTRIHTSIPVEHVTPTDIWHLTENVRSALLWAEHKSGVMEHCRWIAEQLCIVVGTPAAPSAALFRERYDIEGWDYE